MLPLGVIETSHFAGSIAGAGLLVLSHGLARRLDAAYYLSSLLIVVGMGASLLKGFDSRRPLLLLGRAAGAAPRPAGLRSARRVLRDALLARLDCRRRRRVRRLGLARPVRLQARRLRGRSLVAVRAAGEASRFLRASVGAAIVVLLVGIARLVGHRAHEVEPPDDDDLRRGGRHRRGTAGDSPNLVFLRDKA